MPKTLCDICMEEYEDNDKSEVCPRILNCGILFVIMFKKNKTKKSKYNMSIM